jgi:hypothetical protein
LASLARKQGKGNGPSRNSGPVKGRCWRRILRTSKYRIVLIKAGTYRVDAAKPNEVPDTVTGFRKGQEARMHGLSRNLPLSARCRAIRSPSRCSLAILLLDSSSFSFAVVVAVWRNSPPARSANVSTAVRSACKSSVRAGRGLSVPGIGALSPPRTPPASRDFGETIGKHSGGGDRKREAKIQEWLAGLGAKGIRI